ncbi:MAG: leucine-rich repeat domain-containing protein [Bacteroidales bacterium]|nr:leucine-rich repeat domain-containing protein [Bacteroidales bacterium]
MKTKELFTLLLVCTLHIPTALAQHFEYSYNGISLTYEIISVPDHTVAVINAPSECIDVTIPSVVYCNGEAFKVIEICGCTSGNGAFKNCKFLKSVTLPNTVEYIGDNAFQGCTWLRTVNLSSKLWCIGEASFMGCESLASIKLPPSLKKIESNAFRDTRLSSVTLPSSIREIGCGAFMCSTLKTVKMPRDIGLSMGKILVFSNLYLNTSCYNLPFPDQFTIWSASDFRDHIFSSTSSVVEMMTAAKISKTEQEK